MGVSLKKILKGVKKVALPILGAATGGIIGSLGAGATAATALKGAAVGGLLGYGIQSQNQAVDTQQSQYETSLAQQERLSNSAHQREVADMRAAGLNPVLSATGGSGATSPVVSAGSLPGWYNDDGHSAIQAMLQDRMLASQIEHLQSEATLNNTNAWINSTMLPYQQQLSSAQAYEHILSGDAARSNADSNAINAGVNRMLGEQTMLHTAAQTKWQNIQNEIANAEKPAKIAYEQTKDMFNRSAVGGASNYAGMFLNNIGSALFGAGGVSLIRAITGRSSAPAAAPAKSGLILPSNTNNSGVSYSYR